MGGPGTGARRGTAGAGSFFRTGDEEEPNE